MMKTPREILFKRHEAMEAKLDSVRRAALATAQGREQKAHSPISLRDFLMSLRWHLAGMSAIWLFVLFLRMDTGRSMGMMAVVSPAKVPPPQVILTSLRENRRLLSQMVEGESHDAEKRDLLLWRPHSEMQHPTLMA